MTRSDRVVWSSLLASSCLWLLGCGGGSSTAPGPSPDAPVASGGSGGSAGARPGGSSGGGASGAGGSSGQPGADGPGGSGSGGEASTGGGPGPDGGTPDAAGPPSDAGGFETGSRTLPPPPTQWKEHWFEHDQLLELVDYDDHVALYFDADVPRNQSKWLLSFISRVWQYSKRHYGDMGPDPRLFSIHHQGRYAGGHPSYYYDSSHDNRNVSDCGPGPWNEGAYDMASHEIAHVVESTNFGTQSSPAFPVWRDSKWAEIYQYDVYLALGMTAEAQRVHTRFSNTTDSFPRAGTRWFRDWYFPLYRDHGGVELLKKFFQLLATHFPRNDKRYARNLTFGEYVHFMCGAAGTDCTPQAVQAFGNAWQAQYSQARQDFPGVTY